MTMLIENCGPKIEFRDIAALELELSAGLPESYRESLLRYNGGTPTPDTVDVPGAPGTPTDVQVLFGASSATGILARPNSIPRSRSTRRSASDSMPSAIT